MGTFLTGALAIITNLYHCSRNTRFILTRTNVIGCFKDFSRATFYFARRAPVIDKCLLIISIEFTNCSPPFTHAYNHALRLAATSKTAHTVVIVLQYFNRWHYLWEESVLSFLLFVYFHYLFILFHSFCFIVWLVTTDTYFDKKNNRLKLKSLFWS